MLEEFQSQGFFVAPELLREAAVSRAAQAADALFYAPPPKAPAETYQQPGIVTKSREYRRDVMGRINSPHVLSDDIWRLVTDPLLGETAARLMDADAVQIFYCHLLRKPGSATADTHVGWHQDGQYTPFFQGRFVTAWIPLVDIDEASSPLCYIGGSHREGIIEGSGFSSRSTMEAMKGRLLGCKPIEWKEYEVTGKAGLVSFHDSLIVHGSRGNRSNQARLSITVHMRSSRNKLTEQVSNLNQDTLRSLRDLSISPVIFGHSQAMDFGFLAD